MKLGKAVVKSRFVILILAVALMIPSALGMAFTRVNYDILSYLPDNLDTIKGQDYLLDDFGRVLFHSSSLRIWMIRMLRQQRKNQRNRPC